MVAMVLLEGPRLIDDAFHKVLSLLLELTLSIVLVTLQLHFLLGGRGILCCELLCLLVWVLSCGGLVGNSLFHFCRDLLPDSSLVFKQLERLLFNEGFCFHLRRKVCWQVLELSQAVLNTIFNSVLAALNEDLWVHRRWVFTAI